MRLLSLFSVFVLLLGFCLQVQAADETTSDLAADKSPQVVAESAAPVVLPQKSITAADPSPSSAKLSVSQASNWPLVLLTLLGIIVLIMVMAWMAKRMGGLGAMGVRGMKVVSVLPLGNREKVALIDVNGKQILVGVTAHNINHLQTFDQPVVQAPEAASGDFAQKLQKILSGQQESS